MGPSGATGAAGTGGGEPFHQAKWVNLTLGRSVYIPVDDDDAAPACFNDTTGAVFLRGHMSIFPVPAVGGVLLAYLPSSEFGNPCPCTPNTRDLILTTTAVAYPRSDSVNVSVVPDVCMVRLLIDRFVLPDVNLDFVVNKTDLELIINSTYFANDPTAPSKCPGITVKECGRVDVNRDGAVNVLDLTSVTQSSVLGARVPCGAIYATAFSCGSTRRAPLVPAEKLSFDALSFPNHDGEIRAARSMDVWMSQRDLGHVDGMFEMLNSRLDTEQQERQKLHLQLQTQDLQLQTQDEKLQREQQERHKLEQIVAFLALALMTVASIAFLVVVLKRRQPL